MMQLVRPKKADVSINLLPSDIRSAQNTKRLFQIGAAVAIALLVVLGIITVIVRLQIGAEERKLEELQQRRAILQAEVDALREYEVLKQDVDATKAVLATALAGDVSIARFLDDLDTNLPGDSWITSVAVAVLPEPGVTPQGEASLGTIQYSAFVLSFPGLANWLDTMAEVEGQRFVYLSNGTKGVIEGRPAVTFSASSHLTEKMLSGRCQTETSQCP